MKIFANSFLSLVFIFGIQGAGTLNAQLTLEHTYTGGSSAYPNIGAVRMLMVDLEVDGSKYVIVDFNNTTLKMYHLDHSLFKSISFAAATDFNTSTVSNTSVLYISQHLFDLDNQIEFLYSNMNNPGIGQSYEYITEILNEDGIIEFSCPGGAPVVSLNVPQQQVPIYNTEQGTKLILSMTNGDARIYSLAGTLSAPLIHNGTEVDFLANAYPNPTSNQLIIPYVLPAGQFTGQINLLDINGQLIHSYTVDNNFSELLLNTSDLKSGTYFYELKTENGFHQAKKMIKVD